MKEKMKEIKLNVILSAILTAAVGACLIVWPNDALTVFAQVLGAVLIIAGAIEVIAKLINPIYRMAGTLAGLVVVILGIFIFMKPKEVASLIPIIIGVWLIIHGVQDVVLAIETIQKKGSRAWVSLIIAVLSVLFGVLCIADAFQVVTLTMVFIGVFLVYDGISDLVVVHKVNKAAKDFVADVNAVEIDEDDF